MSFCAGESPAPPTAGRRRYFVILLAVSKPIILASASPRRAELLRNAGIPFRVVVSNLEEAPEPGEEPQEYARRLARDKARVVAKQFPDEPVLAADTVVFTEHHLLEKPADAADAARMLKVLSGRPHEVTTGACLIAGGKEDVRSETTRVYFSALSDAEIADYVATGEPMDKAGAYGIQGRASRFIGKIEGDYFNVVGLPVALVTRMLREHGVL
jgi:septum formation protein